mmetsp:Transcript_35160/g.95321  ORF Transcript_35160/g.95321 Transcript_35160/m.95321 type:complete len:210 (-) Transcript_35160:324-953(-)
MALHQRVVGDEVQVKALLHLLQEGLRLLQLAVHDTRIQGAVVDHDVETLRLLRLQLAKQLERPLDIALVACGADEPHVVLDVTTSSLFKEGLGELSPAALDGELHEAAVHHRVGLNLLCLELLVEVAGLLVLASASVDLHEGLVRGERHGRPRAQVVRHILGESQVLRLRALGEDATAEALAGGEALILHLLEKLHAVLVIGLRMELQQ